MARAFTAVLALASAALADPSSDAVAACAGLSLAQKLSLMSGVGPVDGYSRNSGCAGVCGRTNQRWDNGPQGFGDGTRPGSTTQFPSSLAMAATWDPALAFQYGEAMGEEFWAKGTNIQEGPGVNVARIQCNGRNFEYSEWREAPVGLRSMRRPPHTGPPVVVAERRKKEMMKLGLGLPLQ
jgi:beta-glucosidase